MYYRMSRYKIRPGTEERFFEIADGLRPELKDIPGLLNLHGVALGGENYMTVAVYESAAAAEAASETAQSVFARMGECIDLESISIETGEVIWDL